MNAEDEKQFMKAIVSHNSAIHSILERLETAEERLKAARTDVRAVARVTNLALFGCVATAIATALMALGAR